MTGSTVAFRKLLLILKDLLASTVGDPPTLRGDHRRLRAGGLEGLAAIGRETRRSHWDLPPAHAISHMLRLYAAGARLTSH